MLLLDVAVDRRHLIHIQFACQHHHIGELRVELERFSIGDIELGGQMHFLSDAVGVLHDRNIGSDNGIDTDGVRRIHYLAHQRQILGVHDRIDRQVGLHARLAAYRHDVRQIGSGEVRRRAGTHIEVLDAEIDARGTGLYRRCQALPASYGSHDLNIGAISFQHSVFSFQLLTNTLQSVRH